MKNRLSSKQLLARVGLGMLVVSFMVSTFWSYVSQNNLSGFSTIINIAGQQRMLTEKVGLLTHVIIKNSSLYTEYRQSVAHLRLNNTNIAEFLNSRHFLQKTLDNYESEQEKSKSYLAYIEQIVEGEIAPKPIEHYDRTQDMVKSYDGIVSLLVKDSENAERRFLFAIFGSFLLLVVSVWFSYHFIFRPAQINRKRALSQHAESLALFKKMFHKSNESVLIFDDKWKLVEANATSFALIEQRNFSPIMASHFWLNNVFKDTKKSMTDELNKVGKWNGDIEFNTLSGGRHYMAASGLKIQGKFKSESFYGLTLKDLTPLKKKQEETELLAQTDPLTGCLNRSAIMQRLNKACERASAKHNSAGVLFVDLDGFKTVNDVNGHAVGDAVLVEVAKQLSMFLSDSVSIARYGGDAFIYVCEGDVNRDSLFTLANKICSLFSFPFHIQNRSCRLGVSIGISLFGEDASNANDLVQYADIAIHYSKNSNLSNITFFHHTMLDELLTQNDLENTLRSAVNKKEFSHVYQPIVDLSSGRAIGAELLLRWTSDKLGFVSPAEFIPIAEKNGIIYDIDTWSFSACLNSIRDTQWQEYVSLNVSSLHFKNQNVIDAFLIQLNEAGLENKFIFEITETAIIEDIDQSSLLINKIKQSGYSVAIDDFGTGYTSLYYLKILPFDYIKIDQSFIKDLCDNENSQSISAAIIRLANDLKIKVIAEGVETADIEARLIELGCDYVQGYYYEKPIQLDVLVKKYNSQQAKLKSVSLKRDNQIVEK